ERSTSWTLALAVVLVAGKGDAAPSSLPVRHAHILERAPPRPLEHPDAATSIARAKVAWAASLPAIDVRNRNTNAREKIRLYADDGGIDPSALRAFMHVAESTADLPEQSNGEVAEPLEPRLVQLAFRAACRFGGARMVLVSATRKGTHGKHGTGDALDFQ